MRHKTSAADIASMNVDELFTLAKETDEGDARTLRAIQQRMAIISASLNKEERRRLEEKAKLRGIFLGSLLKTIAGF